MRSYQLAMGIIIFMLSVSIVNATLGLSGPLTAEEIPTSVSTGASTISLTNWSNLTIFAAGVVSAVASLVFRIPVGATIFAVVFSVSSLPFGATLNQLQTAGLLPDTVGVLINTCLVFVYIFGYIQLSSMGGKSAL